MLCARDRQAFTQACDKADFTTAEKPNALTDLLIRPHQPSIRGFQVSQRATATGLHVLVCSMNVCMRVYVCTCTACIYTIYARTWTGMHSCMCACMHARDDLFRQQMGKRNSQRCLQSHFVFQSIWRRGSGFGSGRRPAISTSHGQTKSGCVRDST